MPPLLSYSTFLLFCGFLVSLKPTIAWQKFLSPETREWLDEAVLSKASMTEKNRARKSENSENNENGEEEGAVSASHSMPNLPGASERRAKDVRGVETSGRGGGYEQESSLLATLRDKIRTIGAAGVRGTISERYGVSSVLDWSSSRQVSSSLFGELVTEITI